MNYKQIASYDNFLVANMTLGLLQENGINCHLKDENIITVDPLLNPAVGGIKLMVEENDYFTALGLLKDAETAYLRQVPCPHCHALSLELVEKTERPASLWGRLKNIIAYGQTDIHSRHYCCKSCGAVMTELPSAVDK